MKKISLLLLVMLAVCQIVLSQNIGINSTGATPDASAMLDISATNKGLLIPRVALTATNAATPITSPLASLLVYNTATAGTAPNNVVPGYYYWSGTAWIALVTSTSPTLDLSSLWNVTGNSGTTAGTNFIGTTDAVDLVVKTNNTERARVSSTGNVGIGTSTFDATFPEKLVVNAGTTSSVNAIVGKGSINNYLQLNIQNQSAGTNASSDVVATADNGNETSNFVDLGINSSLNSSGVMGGANDAYLYNLGQNFLIGTGTAAKSLIFMTGGTAQGTNERMRINGTGNVGIGNNNPSYKLDVNGTIRTGNASATNGSIVFSNSTNANTLTLNTGTTSTSYALTFPAAQGGANTVLTNNGSGALSWNSFAAAANTWSTVGNAGINTSTNFLGTTDDKQLILKSNNQSFLELGTRSALGLVQAYTDYTDGTEKVTYVRSAMQFEAPNATFYKPKMWTDTNGNFRVKGSSAGTDYFEFGSTGSSNDGGFEFIIGDDGDEPIIFKSYHYINGMSEIMRLQSGRMAVGSNAFDATNPEKLLIDAGTTSSYNLMTGKGSIDNYLQINVKNSSSGGSASSDVVASANNGNESVNYIDMGINSSGYSNTSLPVLGGANNAYLYSTGNDFIIGNATATKPLRFFTGGTANANERMRIDGTGRVGIGNTSPTEVLDVTGNLKFSGALMPNNSAGTSGNILQSAGTGAPPTWVTPGSLIASTGWSLDGNAVSANKNLGTTTNFPITFITNNLERMKLFANGGLALGASSLDVTNPEKFLVSGVSTINAIVAKGSVNNYMQLNIQNQSAGTNASSDIVATANNGSETTNFVDLGINSSGNTSGVMGDANDAYLYNIGQDFLIGTGTAAKSLIFMTGGTSQASNERMRIDGTGLVGIGKTTPSEALDINGNLRFSGALMPNNSAGTSGYLLQSSGSGAAPVWVAPASGTGWILTGNAGTTAGTNFIGTTDDADLVLKTNDTEVMRIYSGGGVDIDAGIGAASEPASAIYAVGDYNNYLEMNVQNLNNGNLASSDIVATADNGDSLSVYVDMGINSGGYSNGNSNILNGPNVAYLYAHGKDFKIGNGSPNRNLIFFTNPSGGTLGTNTANGEERMRIAANGNVGIGVTGPSYLLHLGSNSAAKPGSNTWTIASDRRLKKEIRPFADGLQVLIKIKPVWYQYNGTANMPDDGKNYVGIIAQEMQDIAPYTIDTFRDPETGTDYLNYDSNAITYILINSVKEQQTEIDALKKQLEEQNQRLLKLEEKLR